MNDSMKVLKEGGIAVVRTDTVYGLLGRADLQKTVERIFTVKGRDRSKTLIVLLVESSQAFDGQELVQTHSAAAQTPTTVVVFSPHAPAWLQHRDGTVAYRVPQNRELQALLRYTGPLVAPSANPQGKSPARTIAEAKTYFGDQVDVYWDGGTVPASVAPSSLVQVSATGKIHKLR